LKNVNQILETVTQGHQNFLLDDVSDRSKALVTFSIVTPKPSAFDSDAKSGVRQILSKTWIPR
jgi:hypothetical protein